MREAVPNLEVLRLLIDVTVRHPMASAYQSEASRTAGSTAAAAETQKLGRYPPRAGRSVAPFAVETWGRLGESAEELLQTLAAVLGAKLHDSMPTLNIAVVETRLWTI